MPRNERRAVEAFSRGSSATRSFYAINAKACCPLPVGINDLTEEHRAGFHCPRLAGPMAIGQPLRPAEPAAKQLECLGIEPLHLALCCRTVSQCPRINNVAVDRLS